MATDTQSNAMHDVTMNQRKEEKPSLQLKTEVKFFSKGAYHDWGTLTLRGLSCDRGGEEKKFRPFGFHVIQKD